MIIKIKRGSDNTNTEVKIDDKLNFNHINKLCKSASNQLNTLRKKRFQSTVFYTQILTTAHFYGCCYTKNH